MCTRATIPSPKIIRKVHLQHLADIRVSRLYLSSQACRIRVTRHGRNQHRSDINIHYIPNDPHSPDLESCCQPPPPSSSVRSRSNGTSAYRFVIYGESLASRLSDEARAATVGDSSFGSPYPAAASSSTRHQDLPDFRYLSFRHSLGLVESPFSPGWLRRDYHSEIMILRKGKSSVPLRSTRAERRADSRN